jgi:RNA polymerase subunit RPABC4/transcription elongation factor Spt4
MNAAFCVSWLAICSSLDGRIGPSNPYYIAYVFFGVLMFGLLIGLRKWRGDKITWSIKGITMKKEDVPSSLSRSEINLAVLNQIGNSCPVCGAVVGAEAIVCPRCGSSVPKTVTEASPQQPQVGIAPEAIREARTCPSCGIMVAGGVDTCPQCNWRLRKPAAASTESQPLKCPSCGIMVASGVDTCPQCNWRLNKPAAAASQPHIGIVRRDVIIGGAVAFKKDEWVNIEYESPDPERPEFKYVVRSRNLDKRFRLSDRDLSK